MKALPTQERALKKRQALLDAAQLEFTEKDFEQTTAKSITERAGVSIGTFYQYFDNKEEILLLLTQARFDFLHQSIQEPDLRIFNEAEQDIKGLFRKILNLIYDYHKNDPGFHQVLEHRRCIDPELNEVIEKGESVLIERTKMFVRMFNCDNPDTVAFCLFSMAEGLVHRHVFTNSRVGKKKVIDLGVDMLSAYFEQYDKK